MDKKYYLLVPIAGRGTRMEQPIPKAMIFAGDRTIIEWSMDSIDYSECQIVFVILEEHAHNFSLDDMLTKQYPGCKIVLVKQHTRGALETALVGAKELDSQYPLIVYCPDIWFRPKYMPQEEDFTSSGMLLTFKANSPNYSYVRKTGESVVETREKIVISQDAAVGVYCFDKTTTFRKYAEKIVYGEKLEQGEFYICPMYNDLITDGLAVRSREIETIYIMGTAIELDFFERIVFPYMRGPSELVLCSDHSGYQMKENTKEWIAKIKVTDVGTYSERDCDRYDFLRLVKHRMDYAPGAYGLGFCRSGQGMAMDASKMGLRAALVADSSSTQQAVEHNAANFFAIPNGADYRGILDALVTSHFQGGRHQNRLQKIGV